jgi:hypothetical protein
VPTNKAKVILSKLGIDITELENNLISVFENISKFPDGHGGMPGMKFMKHFRSGEVDGEMTEGEETFFQRMEDQHKNQAQ